MFTCIFASHRNCTNIDRPLRRTYKVVVRSGRVFKVLIKGKVETVTADRVKPAHIECTPENENTTQSTTRTDNANTSSIQYS